MAYDDDSELMKQMRKQNKEKDRQLKEVTDRLAQLEAERNAVGVADLLASNGLDPRVAKFYPKDAGTDKESVDQWVEDNKELFGNRRIVDNGNQNDDTLTDAERRGYQMLQDISAYEAGIELDWKTQLDSVEYDRDDPIGSQNRLLAKIEELARYSNM